MQNFHYLLKMIEILSFCLEIFPQSQSCIFRSYLRPLKAEEMRPKVELMYF